MALGVGIRRFPKHHKPQMSNKHPRFTSQFLNVAFEILYEHKSALTAKRIVDIAFERGYFSDKRIGLTPVQTMKSKLSVFIKTHGDESPFVRTGKGLSPPPSHEEVLAFPRELLDGGLRFQGITENWQPYARLLLKGSSTRYISRIEAEGRQDFKQVLTYISVTKGTRVLFVSLARGLGGAPRRCRALRLAGGRSVAHRHCAVRLCVICIWAFASPASSRRPHYLWDVAVRTRPGRCRCPRPLRRARAVQFASVWIPSRIRSDNTKRKSSRPPPFMGARLSRRFKSLDSMSRVDRQSVWPPRSMAAQRGRVRRCPDLRKSLAALPKAPATPPSRMMLRTLFG